VKSKRVRARENSTWLTIDCYKLYGRRKLLSYKKKEILLDIVGQVLIH